MLPLVSVFTFASCQKHAQPSATTQSSTNQSTTTLVAKQANYSGDEYVKGLIFASGPVANLVPELSALKIENFVTNKAMVDYKHMEEDKIIALMNEKKPGFIEKFKTEVTSKDRVRIKNALDEASNVMATIATDYYKLSDVEVQQKISTAIAGFKSSGKYDPNDINKSVMFLNEYYKSHSNSPTTSSGKCVLGIPIAIVAVFMIAIAIDRYVDVERSDRTANSSQLKDGLYKDKCVNSIALNI